jgi:hypothetical protein
MILVLITQFIVVLLIAISWTRGVDNTCEYYKDHPDENPNDWW